MRTRSSTARRLSPRLRSPRAWAPVGQEPMPVYGPVRLKRATRSATLSNALMSDRGARAGPAGPSALDAPGRGLLGEVLTCSGDIISAVQPASPLISHGAHDSFALEPAHCALRTGRLAS